MQTSLSLSIRSEANSTTEAITSEPIAANRSSNVPHAPGPIPLPEKLPENVSPKPTDVENQISTSPLRSVSSDPKPIIYNLNPNYF